MNHLEAALFERTAAEPYKNVAHFPAVMGKHGHDLRWPNSPADMIKEFDGQGTEAARNYATCHTAELFAPCWHVGIVQLSKPVNLTLEQMPLLLRKYSHRCASVHNSLAKDMRWSAPPDTYPCQDLFQMKEMGPD